MFPVKRAAAMLATCLGFALPGSLGASCGYHAVYGSGAPAGRLAVVPSGLTVSEPEASQAVLSGARAELARAGVLGAGGYPRLVVEVVRLDETGAGILSPGETPLARGSTVAVVARGWVEERAGDPAARDTGDMRRSTLLAAGADPRRDAAGYRQALRAAGREVGRAVARRILGEPEPGDEP
jgi:hypothetical protein